MHGYFKNSAVRSSFSSSISNPIRIRHATLPRLLGKRRYIHAFPRHLHLCKASLSPDILFNVVTVAVMPLYTLMIAAPKKPITKSIMSSRWIFYIAALLYAFLLVHWNALSDIADAYRNSTLPHQQASTSLIASLPDIHVFSTLFTNPKMSVIVWLHLLVLDLFQARWVYLDGSNTTVPTMHSLVLCFMVGPLGLLSHFATKTVLEQYRRSTCIEENLDEFVNRT